MTKTSTKVPVRLIADYQMFGDMEGSEWANHILGAAKNDSVILDYTVLNSSPGEWGIQFISFTVDVEVVDGNYDKTKAWGTGLLNQIIGDSDVEVRWVSSLAPVTA